MWNVIKGVLKSRKNVLAILAVICAAAGRFGYNWNAETMAVVVLPFLAAILGIAYEDGQQKAAGAGTTTAAGAGTTTTKEVTKDHGASVEVVKVVPDPTGKP